MTWQKKLELIPKDPVTFNFQLPSMPQTMILEPLSETDVDENDADMLKDALRRIRSLNSINTDETMTFV